MERGPEGEDASAGGGAGGGLDAVRAVGADRAWRRNERLQLGGRRERALLAVLLLEANKVVVFDRAHRFADPVRRACRGDRESDVVQRLEDLGADVMCTVFVAHDTNQGDLPVHERPALLVLLGQLGIQVLEHHLAHAGGLSHPDRGGNDQDVRGKYFLPQRGPLVPVTLVDADPEPDIMIGHSYDVTLDIVIGGNLEHPASGRPNLIPQLRAALITRPHNS